MEEWEKKSPVWDKLDHNEETKENSIKQLMTTGVRYDFMHIGITVFSTWGFFQYRTDGKALSDITASPDAFYYNRFTGEFRPIRSDDELDIDFG